MVRYIVSSSGCLSFLLSCIKVLWGAFPYCLRRTLWTPKKPANLRWAQQFSCAGLSLFFPQSYMAFLLAITRTHYVIWVHEWTMGAYRALWVMTCVFFLDCWCPNWAQAVHVWAQPALWSWWGNYTIADVITRGNYVTLCICMLILRLLWDAFFCLHDVYIRSCIAGWKPLV